MSAEKAPSSINEISDAQAKEFDYIIAVDASGSMSSPSDKMEGKTRWQEAAEFTEGLARFAAAHDDDGITLIKFNSTATVFDNVTAQKVTELFAKNQPNGSTNLAAALREIVKKRKATTKKVIAFIITDGTPDSQAEAERVIVDAANGLEKDDDLSFQFLQIGNDPGAAKYLQHLDDELTGKAKFDIVNSLDRVSAEKLTFGQLMYQAIND